MLGEMTVVSSEQGMAEQRADGGAKQKERKGANEPDRYGDRLNFKFPASNSAPRNLLDEFDSEGRRYSN